MSAEDWTDEPVSSLWDTVNDFGRAVTNAATFGMGNRIKGYLSGTGTDEQVKLSEQARERSPTASFAGDVYGSLGIPALGAENLALRTGTALAPTLGRAAPAVGRAIGYGVSGAATGAAQGAGNTYTGNLPDYAQNAAIGGALGGVLGSAGGAAFGTRPAVSAAVTPDAARLATETDAAYNTFRALPAQYTPASFADRALAADQALRTAGHFDASRELGGSPVPFRATEQMRAPPTAFDPVTGAPRHIRPADIDTVRKGVTGDRIADLGRFERSGADVVRRAIDDFVLNPPAGSVVPGTEAAAAQAGSLYNRARALHAGTMRTETLDEMVRNAERTSGATYSGLNLRNELQKTIRSGLKEKKGESPFSRAGYSPAELSEFDRFSRGQGTASRVLGYADKYLGGGGGLGALAAGSAAGHFGGQYFKDDPETGLAVGLGASGLGLGLRLLGNRRAASDINQIRNMVAQRNPLYMERAAVAPMVPGPGSPLAAKSVRDAVTLELMKQTGVGQQTPASDWE